jgi:ADP-L-glycero-D-manno-heptose 6-epimerase
VIVVTGGAGFIGSALIWALNRQGCQDILVVDSLGRSEKWRNLLNLRFADYMSKEAFIGRLDKGIFDQAISGVLHMGACSDTTEANADYLLSNNFEYTKQLTKWCIEHNKRFVYASSAATYGDGRKGFSDDHEVLEELRPLNIYGYSKHLFDLWALRNGALDHIAGLKYFNVFGPNEYHKGDMRSVVHKAFEEIRSTGKVRLFKSYNPQYRDGWQMRDFTYIKDAVDMTLYIFDNPSTNGIYNVGSGKARSFYDLVAAVFHAMGLDVNIEYIEMSESLRDQYQYFTQADMAKIKSCGYKGKIHSLEESITEYVKRYLLADDPYLNPYLNG